MYEPLTNRQYLEWEIVIRNGNQISNSTVSSTSPNSAGITLISELAVTQPMPSGYISRDASQRQDVLTSIYK
jgi:hypothetical protein